MRARRPIAIDDLYHIITVEDAQLSPDERWLACVYLTIDRLENAYRRHVWLVPTDGSAALQLTRAGSDTTPRWSPDGTQIAFVSARAGKPQIYLIRVTAPGGEAYPITDLPNGAASPVWSPDGRQIAFLSSLDADERAHEGDPRPAPPADKLEARHRRERRDHEEARRLDPFVTERVPYRDGFAPTPRYLDGRCTQLYVMDISDGVAGIPRRLTDFDADHREPVWMPDGSALITSRAVDVDLNEPWRFEQVYRVTLDGTSQRLTLDDGFIARGASIAPDGTQIAYIRTETHKLYTHSSRLAVLDLTTGAAHDLWQDRAVTACKWGADGAIWFSANDAGNTEIYAARDGNARNGGYAITKAIWGVMEVQSFSIGGRGGVGYIASTAESPTEAYYKAADGEARQISFANRAWLDGVIVQPTYEFRFPSHDGLEIQGWYLLPVGYQDGTRVPLTVHIHGGPRVMWGAGFRTQWHEHQVHAANGYAVLFINARGSDGYGEAFQRFSFGDPDFPDQMGAVDWLIARGIADEARLGVTGGSYGGYMTGWIIGHTTRFKAAVAQRGVYNLATLYGTTDIPMFTTDEFEIEPWEDPLFFWRRSPLAYAHQITTPLLLIHGENDWRAPISESEQLYNFIRQRGGVVRMMRQPREGHDHSRSGEPLHRVQRLEAMLGWFDTHLKERGE
jgi:dipeptidyl aminopeptidase/acylaminoacyl peptidase